MEALQVAPASASSDTLLHLLLRAHRRSEGLLLVELEGEAAANLHTLKQQHRAAALQEKGAALQIAPHTTPGVASALHKLACRLTKAQMLRLGEHPYQLHRHLDSLQDWLHPSRGGTTRVHSSLLVSAADRVGQHIDRRLFNIVVGTAADLAPIHMHVGGDSADAAGGSGTQTVHLAPLLPADAGPAELFGLVIPGYTLQCLDPLTDALPHSVIAGGDGLSKRSTVVLQWRLSTEYVIDGWSVQELLAGFESVRTPAASLDAQPQQAEAERAKPESEVAWSAPTLPALPDFILHLKRLDGRTDLMWANPQWTVADLKWVVSEKNGIPPNDQRLIFAGWQLEDGKTLLDSHLCHECTVHLIQRLRGD